MRRQFYPETDDWKEAVLFRGHQIVRQAIAGVQRGASNGALREEHSGDKPPAKSHTPRKRSC